jgi:exosortase
MNRSLTSQEKTLVFSGIAIVLLSTLLLSLQYSYGVGTTTYSLARFIWINWNDNEDMGHGFFILPAVFFIIYQDRKRLLSLTPECGPGGLLFLGIGLFLFWAGNQADVTFVGLLSFMMVLAGAVWWLLGWKFLKALSFPIGFLIFAIPFPGLDMMVALPLRFIMSKVSVFLLNLIGVPVILNGTGILSAPDATLHLAAGQRFAVDVANPCSGIRSLFALMMVSALFAHFTLKETWKKWTLFCCALPLAVAGNLARIIMLTLGTVAFGSEFAIGKNPLTDPSWFHLAAGYLVFIVALAGMMGIASLLGRISAASNPFFSLNKQEGTPSSALSSSETSSASRPSNPSSSSDLY